MSSATTDYMYARAAREFRDLVAFGLTIRTGLAVKPAPADDGIGDLDGLPGIAIITRAGRSLRFSQDLDKADALAADHPDDGTLGVLVQRRQARPIGESYALMTLDSLGELIRRAES